MCILTEKKPSISFKGKIESISCEHHEMPKVQHALNKINCWLSEIAGNELLITLQEDHMHVKNNDLNHFNCTNV